ncbi:MAG: methyl-accepting chemotaxis protein, partial [Archaeoglobaceae archaeon]|nr:methyl-accepting chemotaxis protein [Archaeoglobaceae archaeon]
AGMEQISTASQQIATGSENLSKLANTALGEVKAAEKIFKDLESLSAETEKRADDSAKKATEARELGEKSLEKL